WDKTAGEQQQQNPGRDDTDQKPQGTVGHVVEQIRVEGDSSASDRKCNRERCTYQARLGSKPQIAGSWLEREQAAGNKEQPDQDRSRKRAPFQILESTARGTPRQYAGVHYGQRRYCP